MNDFNKIAWCYDLLAKLVFGNRLENAQNTFLHLIKAESRVLILGGGTGAIAEAVLQRQQGCSITYIDASSAMINRARLRLKNYPHVQFIHGTEDSIPTNVLFDAVITPYFLDVFPEDQLPSVINRIGRALGDEALWLVADFCPSRKLRHRAMLAIMYQFFRWTAKIEARTLPEWSTVLSLNGWSKTNSLHVNGFLESAVFKRTARPT